MLTLFFIVSLIIILAYVIYFEHFARKFGVSTSHTSRRMRKAIIAEIHEAFPGAREKILNIVDPGCGSAGLPRAIARHFPNSTVTGLELSPLPFWQAQLATLMIGPRNFHVLRQDFFTHDYRAADVVVVFLPEPVLHRLAPKLAQDMKPGAVLLSNAFQMPAGWQVYKGDIIEKLLKRRLYCYRVS